MTEPTDTEILEFLLDNFQMYSPKMNGQHSGHLNNCTTTLVVGGLLPYNALAIKITYDHIQIQKRRTPLHSL